MIRRTLRFARRHPALYRIRFALITRPMPAGALATECANRYHGPTDVPAPYLDAVRRIAPSGADGYDAALQIAQWLSGGRPRGCGLSCGSVEALRRIEAGEAGMCSDYSQVFTGLCIAAGIPAREWGCVSDFLGGRTSYGHAFNEVYSAAAGRWVLIDAYRSVRALDARSRIPMGVVDVRRAAEQDGGGSVLFEPIDHAAARAEPDALARLYLHPDQVFLLIANNRVFAQDRWLRWSHALPLPLLHAAMLVGGVYQRYWLLQGADHHCGADRKYLEMMRGLGLGRAGVYLMRR